MDGKIVTVRGEILANELGFCQPHEHISVAEGSGTAVFPQFLNDDPVRTVVDARAFRAAGGRAIADAQPVFSGRRAAALREVSERGDIHVIASTGFHKLFYYGENNPYLDLGEDELAEIFISEIETGMFAEPFYSAERGKSDANIPKCSNYSGQVSEQALSDIVMPNNEHIIQSSDSAISSPALSPVPCKNRKNYSKDSSFRTDIRAGLIKSALEPEFTDLHEKFFAAVSHASLRTGVAIMIHIDKETDPLLLMDFLEERGVQAERMIYCHLDRNMPDLDVHRALARRGAYLEYDTVARPHIHSDDTEAKLICGMISEGFTDRLMVSLDTTRMRLKGFGGTPGLAYILTDFVPILKAHGLADTDISSLFVANPARALAIVK